MEIWVIISYLPSVFQLLVGSNHGISAATNFQQLIHELQIIPVIMSFGPHSHIIKEDSAAPKTETIFLFFISTVKHDQNIL